MAKYLVIVESPAKVKTIKKFLGTNYQVVASNGHVRDLPKSSLGIDVDHDFEPKYITIRGKGDVLANLRKEVKKAERVYLATDPDREGEAISWHLYTALKLEDKPTYRITFNEITARAVKESLKHPREIDMNLVDAQQTRRILDRIVGYRISPVLWAKIKGKLSAGRVQSATLKMICDRENEIAAFIPEEFWTLDAQLKVEGQKKSITAKYYGNTSGKRELKSREEVDAVIRDLKKASFKVREVKNGERTRKAPLPFTTSTLQQEASKQLNFTTQKTMRLAQQLYEGVEIRGEGTVGLISYLRTDSTRVSEEAQEQAKKFIDANYGTVYQAKTEAKAKESQKIQDAHEAIRPTDVSRIPSAIKDQLPRDLYRLYALIWKRFLASRMAEAKYETTSVKIQAKEEIFTLSAARLLFDGFLSVYRDEEEEETNALKAAITADSKLSLEDFDPKQHFTQPPAHYTEAALVHEMEQQGIGRPSTYAPTITNLLGRRYVSKEQKNIFVTELGNAVNDMMNQAFPSIVDMRFTANMETLLDGVEEGSVRWKTVIENFYPDLDEAVKAAEKDLEEVKIADEVSEEICENCGVHMVIKYGPHGKFLGCPNFPQCRNTKPYYEKIGVACPECGKDLVIRMSKKGRRYFGCMGFPECNFMSWDRPVAEKCPKCGSYMVQKGNRMVCANKECGTIISNTIEK